VNPRRIRDSIRAYDSINGDDEEMGSNPSAICANLREINGLDDWGIAIKPCLITRFTRG
jgi:hypothetical protein